MSYRFDLRDGSLTEALHRIALSQITPIQRTLAEGPDPVGIHDIRKQVKKLRALLRLLRAGLPRVQPAETVLLRDAARLLAAQRDAVVRLATLDSLILAEDGPEMLAFRAHLAIEAETMPNAFEVSSKSARSSSSPTPSSERKLTRMKKRSFSISSNWLESVMLQPFWAR